MKEFSCGDVVPGCPASFRAATEDALLELVAQHAREDHGLTELAPELIADVKRRIRTVSAP
jgi:predicted small metal-binding protein